MKDVVFRREWLWAAAVVVLISAPHWWTPPVAEKSENSFSIAPAGRKAFYLLLEKLFPDVSRNLEGSLVPEESVDTLCVVGPARYPSRNEWGDLYRWVREGRTLFFACRRDDPNVDLREFGVAVRSTASPNLENDDLENDESGGPTSSRFVDGNFEWRSQGRVTGEFDDVLVTSPSGPQVVIKQVENGLLIVSTSDFLFTNIALARRNAALLAVRIIEEGNVQGPLRIDESLSREGGARVFGLLFGSTFLATSLQVIICALLFAWIGHFRFGPATSLRGADRRSFAEHAAALGNLHLKARNGRAMLTSYWEYFRNELHLRRRPDAAMLARRSGLPPELISRVLEQVDGSGELSVQRAASLIRRLTLLLRRVKHSKER